MINTTFIVVETVTFFSNDAISLISGLYTFTEGRGLILNTAQLAEKSTRDSQGVQVMTLKTKYKLKSAEFLEGSRIVNRSRYTARSLPAAGALLKPEDTGETQITMEGE